MCVNEKKMFQLLKQHESEFTKYTYKNEMKISSLTFSKNKEKLKEIYD